MSLAAALGLRPLPLAAPASLFVRTSLALGVSAVAIVITTVLALNVFVVDPIEERSADDVAALLVLSAQTWVELPPEARPYFELELAERHDLIVSGEVRNLPLLAAGDPFLDTLEAKLSERLGDATNMHVGNELVWVDVPMGGHQLQIGLSADRRDIQPIYVAITIFVIGATIVFITSFLVVQRITRPLVDVASSAAAFRGGEEFPRLPESGPAELVTLAKSFNTMATGPEYRYLERRPVIRALKPREISPINPDLSQGEKSGLMAIRVPRCRPA